MRQKHHDEGRLVPPGDAASKLRSFIAEDPEQNAALVTGRILNAINLLLTRPARPGRVLGTRELVIPDMPFIIPYRVRRDRLERIAVFNGRSYRKGSRRKS